MASKDTRKNPGVPAKNGGNRANPALAKKLTMPDNHKSTYGVGDGAGGNPVAANNGGNRANPALAGKLTMPTAHDSYQGNGGK